MGEAYGYILPWAFLFFEKIILPTNRKQLTMKKKLLLSLAMFAMAMASWGADKVWCMQTNTGQLIRMSNVSYILAEGAEPETFSVVLKEGNPVENVGKVTFLQAAPTGISQVETSDDIPMLTQVMGNELTISGTVEGQTVAVLSVSGAMLQQTVTTQSSTHINIGHLTSGVYILKVGSKAIKFIKK